MDEAGDRMEGLTEEVMAIFEESGPDSAEIARFLGHTSETCARLHDQIEALTVAKVGLEAILSAYDSRYGDQAVRNKDVSLFKNILNEKEELLASLEAGLQDQARRVEEFLRELDNHRAGIEKNLGRFEEACQKVRESCRTRNRRLDADRAKIEAIQERYWPESRERPAHPERINLPKETLHRVVDDVLERMASDRTARSELIGQVLISVRDEDLKTVLSQKMAPSLDELPEVSDDEFWGD